MIILYMTIFNPSTVKRFWTIGKKRYINVFTTIIIIIIIIITIIITITIIINIIITIIIIIIISNNFLFVFLYFTAI